MIEVALLTAAYLAAGTLLAGLVERREPNFFADIYDPVTPQPSIIALAVALWPVVLLLLLVAGAIHGIANAVLWIAGRNRR